MDLKSLIEIISSALEALIKLIPVIIFLIPKLLQLIGIFGWLWHGYNLMGDNRTKYRLKLIFRCTIIWFVGFGLDFLLNTYGNYLI